MNPFKDYHHNDDNYKRTSMGSSFMGSAFRKFTYQECSSLNLSENHSFLAHCLLST